MKRIHVHTARMLGLAMVVGVFGGACSGDSGNAHFDQCLPDVPADECYASRRDPESDQVALASEIALRYIDEQGRPFVTGISGPTAHGLSRNTPPYLSLTTFTSATALPSWRSSKRPACRNRRS